MSGRALGLDPGERRIGVAVSDPTGTIASPVRYIDVARESVDEALRQLRDEWAPEVIVVGLPINLDGSEGASASMARTLGERVASVTGLAVEFHDERFTSRSAETLLISSGMKRRKRTEKRDQIAAAVMLQGWLDRRTIQMDVSDTETAQPTEDD